ncbi:MAG: hypothetical protein GY926_05810 [bacterium]|nr:hypothetical protein [bacterium]
MFSIGRLLLLAALATITMIGTTSAVSAHPSQGDPGAPSEPGSEGQDFKPEHPGLGNYGRTGPIERPDLGPDLAARVSDRAIAMAMSPALAQARESWDEEFDFVWQVDYQLRFRERVDYMATDADHIGRIMSNRSKNVGIERLGLFLDVDEAKEFNRRDKLGDRIPQVRKAIGEDNEEDLDEEALPEYGPNFGGIWQDQLGGGDIIVAVVDPSKVDAHAINRAAGKASDVRIVQVDHSWDEFNSMRDAVVAEIVRRDLDAAVLINSTGTGRRLEIVTPEPDLLDPWLASVVPVELVTVTVGENDRISSGPSYTHSAADQQAGLQIEIDPGYATFCTWGVSGHTSTYNYIVTAGHCGTSTYENFSGTSYAFEIQQNDTFDLTPGPSYVHSFYGYNQDAKRVSSQYADNNCYHADGHCTGFIRYRSLNNSWEVGSDMTCASLGTTNAWECGWIAEENYVSTSSACEGNQWVRYTIDTSPGDSGSGLVYWSGSGVQLAIDAIHHCSVAASGGLDGIGMTAYRVKQTLGFDYNCASSAVTSRSASNWGSCPTINR